MSTTQADACLEHICSVDDIFRTQLLPFLSHYDVGRLERVSRTIANKAQRSWRVLMARDFPDVTEMTGPVYSEERQSFDTMQVTHTWKGAYVKWYFWAEWTQWSSTARDLMQAIDLAARLKRVLVSQGVDNVLDSLCPCLSPQYFEKLVSNWKDTGHTGQTLPSSLMAFYSVIGGQQPLQPRSPEQTFFSGLLGSYACYRDFYSMRLLPCAYMFPGQYYIAIGTSAGNPPVVLYVEPCPEDPQGRITIGTSTSTNPVAPGQQHIRVGQGGFLNYLQTYVQHLEAGVYKRVQVIDQSPYSQGIGIFPDAGDTMSCSVTRGIEVRASARWFPIFDQDEDTDHGINFGYSIRIQMLEPTSDRDFDTCQLVSRHWEFMDGNGHVRRVDGQAVVGKQPVLYRENGKPCYVDLGEAGDGYRYRDKVFIYQSQSGPVAGTTHADTNAASVRGTFAFCPGSIANPAGPLFHVTVAPFPLTVPTPFY
jgi:uncharacterized protein affecting Mg2+/Co2+ transport